MSNATIKGFFNPRQKGDNFKGLNSTIEGEVAEDVIQDVPTFLKRAGRDYYIKKVPAYVNDPFGGVDEQGNVVPAFREAENQYHLVRSNDHRVVSPHTVTDQYAPLSLMDMADEVQPWCNAGWATPDGVYEARGGSLEVLSLRLDAGGNIGGDEFIHYAVFQNPHGAGGKACGKIISWRIVCANTFAAAVSATADFKITHRVGAAEQDVQQGVMAERVKAAVDAWEQVKEHIARLSERVNRWQSSPLTKADATELANRLFGITNESKAATRTKNRRDAVVTAFDSPQYGTNGANAWDWLNAVTFFTSSPYAPSNKKVDPIARTLRATDSNGSGFSLESKAERLIESFIS